MVSPVHPGEGEREEEGEGEGGGGVGKPIAASPQTDSREVLRRGSSSLVRCGISRRTEDEMRQPEAGNAHSDYGKSRCGKIHKRRTCKIHERNNANQYKEPRKRGKANWARFDSMLGSA